MPIFQYQDYQDRYGPSIAEALGHQGDVQAQLALQQGAIAAQAARDRGAMWGNILGTVGETAVAIPQHRLQAQRQALADQEARQRMAITGYQLDDAKRTAETRSVFDAVLKDPANYKDDGTIDPARVTSSLQQSGNMGAVQAWQTQLAKSQQAALERDKTVAEIAEKDATTREKKNKANTEQQETLGKAMFSGSQALDERPDQALQARDTLLQHVGQLAASGAIPAATANQIYRQAAMAGPDELRGLFNQYVAPDLRAKVEKEQADARKARAEAGKAESEAINGPTLTGDTLIASLMGREGNGETLNARDKALLEGWKSKEGLKPVVVKTVDAAGREVELHTTAAEALRHGVYRAPPTAAQQNATDVTALSPAGLDAAALNYAKTGVLPPLGMGDKNTRKLIINRAAEMMPGLDIASARADYAANTDSLKTMQKQRDAIGAFEQTAMKNIDIFLDAAGKVVDTGSPLANSLARQVTGKMLGSPDQAAYDAARQVAVNEIAKIVSNPTLSGTLSDSARHEVEAFNPATATLQQSVAVMRLLKRDMGNRTSALDDGIAGIKSRISKGAPAAGVTILSITPKQP
jgi:hypothetical protein